MRYSSHTTQVICQGQWMDLEAMGKPVDMAQLETISELKTGLAIEAALLIPAILGGANDFERKHLKQFAYHLGIAFQIRDDMLDYMGDEETLGKPIGQDEDQLKATFVTCLGIEGANHKLFEHYYLAQDALKHLGNEGSFLAQDIRFVLPEWFFLNRIHQILQIMH